jgi:hypothetical protein
MNTINYSWKLIQTTIVWFLSPLIFAAADVEMSEFHIIQFSECNISVDECSSSSCIYVENIIIINRVSVCVSVCNVTHFN